MKRQSRIKRALRSLVLPAVILLSLSVFIYGVANVSRGQAEEKLERLENTVRLAALSCYATEGYYPPSADFLRENYGLTVDEERYIIHYEIFAENLMPHIKVAEIGDKK